MIRRILLPLVFVSWPALCAAASSNNTPGDGNWPRKIDTGDIHLVVYQPQVDSWKGNRIEARSAVVLTRNSDPAQFFGIVSLAARTEVDGNARMVSFEDVVIKDADFPTAASLKPALVKAVRDAVPTWPRVVSLDRLIADLEVTQAETKAESLRLKNDPPKIIWSKTPAVLILLDGEPVYRAVEGSPYSRVINTPALLLFNSAAGKFYLDGEQWWMTAASLNGPWTATANPPSDLDGIRQQFTKDEEKQPAAEASSARAQNPPAVLVSTTPAELLVTRGATAFSPIPKTGLLYVANSDDDIFMETASQQYYALLAGRWFRAKSLDGPWEWVSGGQLPRDFSRIAPGGPKGHVLASIPGTEQAREAAIANQIPETATVRRSEAKLDVRYQGAPEFRPIEDTMLDYATNTSSEVIRAEGRYYAVEHGVWFVAETATGPWEAATMIPAAIYTIPPSSPLFHLRYVYVYGSTPEYVYVGYTPGYMGAFVSDGVVVFGTGWWYPGIFCGDFWCGWPWTWGFGFRFSYWGGGWFWRPAHSFWWYHNPPFTHRVFTEHWNPRWNTPGRSWVRGNVNAYTHWSGTAVVPHTVEPRGATTPNRSSRPDLYAGRDGQVYQRRSDGWYQQNPSGNWQKAPAPPALDQQRDSRSLGQSRQREFEQRGQTPGVPRSTMPPGRPSSPRSSSGPGGRR